MDRPISPRRRVLAVTVVLLAVLAACGKDTEKPGISGDPTTTTTEATTTTAAQASSGGDEGGDTGTGDDASEAGEDQGPSQADATEESNATTTTAP